MKKVAVLQSNYIPWKGYFDFINSVDVFILYDVVQFTKNDWRNRNRLVINSVPTWVTIPVFHNRLDQKIDETKISNSNWAKKHWRSIEQSYGKTSGFGIFGYKLGDLYSDLSGEAYLSVINERLISFLCDYMGIRTKILSSSDFDLPTGRVERLIYLCKAVDASNYVSGPAASVYLDPETMNREGIACEWYDYSGYPKYHQRGDSFEHSVSVLDLLFNEGSSFRSSMKSF